MPGLSGAVARCLFLSALFAVVACTPTERNYLRNGVGASLAPSDIQASTQLLDDYFASLCEQSGLLSYASAAACPPPPGSDAWTLIVLQGMNDIDRRCDAYLEWLDDKRRSRAPMLAQINDMQTATTSIIGLANPASVAAISIVGLAFGLLSSSVENYHSRLLLLVDSSTVNSIVIEGRFRFRRETLDLTYANRPAAEYALRSYLRICLPFAIETQVNDLSILGSRRQVPGRGETIIQSPAEVPIRGMGVLRAGAPVTTRSVRPASVPAAGWDKVSSIKIDVPTARTIQSGLCLTPRSDGRFDEQTEFGLKIYLSVSKQNPRDADWRANAVALKQPNINDLRKAKCAPGARNYLESHLFADGVTRSQILKKLRKHTGDNTIDIATLRRAVAEWRLGPPPALDNGPDGMFADQITPDLYRKMTPAQQ